MKLLRVLCSFGPIQGVSSITEESTIVFTKSIIFISAREKTTPYRHLLVIFISITHSKKKLNLRIEFNHTLKKIKFKK